MAKANTPTRSLGAPVTVETEAADTASTPDPVAGEAVSRNDPWRIRWYERLPVVWQLAFITSTVRAWRRK